MTEEEKYNREIRDIFSFLTEGEPTPDDEIESKNKLIEKFKILKTVKKFQDISGFLDIIINKLENWDTLDLWFKEMDDLIRDIEKFIKITSTISGTEIKKEELEKTAKIGETTGSPQIDVKQIFSEVSGQFMGEIKSLKDKIEDLQKELGKKDEQIDKLIKEKPVQKLVPKRETKLAPPQIKLPPIKKPLTPPPQLISKPKQESKSLIDEIDTKIAEIKPTKVEEEEVVPKPTLAPLIKPTSPSDVSETPLKEPQKIPKFILSPSLTGVKPAVKIKAKSTETEPTAVEELEKVPEPPLCLHCLKNTFKSVRRAVKKTFDR